jgi:hypothetical protein
MSTPVRGNAGYKELLEDGQLAAEKGTGIMTLALE